MLSILQIMLYTWRNKKYSLFLGEKPVRILLLTVLLDILITIYYNTDKTDFNPNPIGISKLGRQIIRLYKGVV